MKPRGVWIMCLQIEQAAPVVVADPDHHNPALPVFWPLVHQRDQPRCLPESASHEIPAGGARVREVVEIVLLGR